jgi:hypothetical protein
VSSILQPVIPPRATCPLPENKKPRLKSTEFSFPIYFNEKTLFLKNLCADILLVKSSNSDKHFQIILFPIFYKYFTLYVPLVQAKKVFPGK